MRHAIALAVLIAAGTVHAAEPAAAASRTVQIKVTDAGFEPRTVKLKKGEPVKLVFTRVTEQTCITAIDIPAEKVAKLELPLNKPVELALTPKKAGVEAFHCSAMGMGDGKLVVE